MHERFAIQCRNRSGSDRDRYNVFTVVSHKKTTISHVTDTYSELRIIVNVRHEIDQKNLLN